MLKNIELRKLPAGTLSVIVDILEIDNDWKKVMSLIPNDPKGEHFERKYNIEHIRLIEQYAKATNQKCAEILFDEWGTSGRVRPTLSTLKNLVVAAGVFRAGDEIARLLQELPPARPTGGPEQQITTNVTEMLNQSLQQDISTAQAKDYENKNVYQNQSTEPIEKVYYGVESLNTEDLPYFSELQPEIGNKPTVQMKSVSDLMKFTIEESISELNGQNVTDVIKDSSRFGQLTVNSNQQVPQDEFNHQSDDKDKDAKNVLGESLKPSSNIDLDSVISQDTNLIHFKYFYLEMITNYFSENPPNCEIQGSPGKIGSGGFGDVFIGNHPELGALAIKRASQYQLRYYKPEVVSKVFNSEVKYLSKFRHKNIVPILGYSVDGPAPCIVCEYIAGGSLLQKISEKVLNEEQRINIMIGAAEGLKYLHTSNKNNPTKSNEPADSDSRNPSNNFMHGDVKSANILLTEYNEPKLCDFGLAKQYEATCEVSHPMGTSAYMSPEGLRGTITQKLDVYSYGIVLLELLTGLPPIVKHQNEKINIKHYVNENCGNGDISQLLEEIAQWTKADNIFKLAQMCLEDDRNKRPTMSVVCDALHIIKDK